MIWRKEQALKIGDLVYHLMYGEEWLGVIMKLDKTPDVLTGNERAKIHMVPGSEYERYFQKSWTSSEYYCEGWVSSKWLIKLAPKIATDA